MSYSGKLISIVITTHNRKNLVERAITSALNQTYKNIEVIVVDDGSTDNTEEIVKNLITKHSNIRYLKHSVPLGANKARNTGINASKGFFIAGLDDDDEYISNRLEVLINNYSDDYSLITSRNQKITKNEKVITKYTPEIDIKRMLHFNAIGNQVLVKRETILEAGLFDVKMKRYQDYDMWIRVINKFGKAKMVKEVTQIIHMEHEETSNNQLQNNLSGALYFYSKHKMLMNKNQRKTQLYKIYQLQGKKLSFRKFIVLLNYHNLKHFIKSKF